VDSGLDAVSSGKPHPVVSWSLGVGCDLRGRAGCAFLPSLPDGRASAPIRPGPEASDSELAIQPSRHSALRVGRAGKLYLSNAALSLGQGCQEPPGREATKCIVDLPDGGQMGGVGLASLTPRFPPGGHPHPDKLKPLPAPTTDLFLNANH
jgi:hypothetical protein